MLIFASLCFVKCEKLIFAWSCADLKTWINIKMIFLLERGKLVGTLLLYIHGKVQLYNISSSLITLTHDSISASASTILVISRTSFLFPVVPVPHQQSQDAPNTSQGLDSIFCDEEIEPFGALEVEAAP